MNILKHCFNLGVALSAALVLTACTPANVQTLDLHPEISVSRQLDPNTRIEVKTADLRTNQVVGFRDIAETPDSAIYLKDSNALLFHTTEHALHDMGVSRLFNGEFLLNVELLELSYKLKKDGLKHLVTVSMRLRTHIEKDGKSYTSTHSAHKEQTYLSRPSEEANAKLVGEVANKTLNLAFNNAPFLDFIQFN